MPPDAWPLHVTAVAGGSLHVVGPVWTAQEGRSDLSLELELRETASGSWDARVLSLHVL
jgi:hypothetical protein